MIALLDFLCSRSLAAYACSQFNHDQRVPPIASAAQSLRFELIRLENSNSNYINVDSFMEQNYNDWYIACMIDSIIVWW